MRHKMKGRKLGRTASHRKSTLQALALALIENKEIQTTLAKAKEARVHMEKLITYTKQDTVHARRLAYRVLNNHQAVKVLFDEIGPAFEDRNGGYTRVIKLGQRIGDGAELAILQLVGFESMEAVAPTPKKAAKTTPKKESGEEAKKTAPAEEKKEDSAVTEKTEEKAKVEEAAPAKEKAATEPTETDAEAEPETPPAEPEEKKEEKSE